MIKNILELINFVVYIESLEIFCIESMTWTFSIPLYVWLICGIPHRYWPCSILQIPREFVRWNFHSNKWHFSVLKQRVKCTGNLWLAVCLSAFCTHNHYCEVKLSLKARYPYYYARALFVSLVWWLNICLCT